MSKAPHDHFLQITAKQQSKRLNKYGTLWDRDLVSVVRIRESRYYRDFFLKKTYENFVGTLETGRVTRRGVRIERFDCIGYWNSKISSCAEHSGA